MFRTLTLLSTCFILGCSDPGVDFPDLAVGEAMLVIDSQVYEGLAVIDTITYGENTFETLSLHISDTWVARIMKANLDEELILWSRNPAASSASGTHLTLSERIMGGSSFTAWDGYLHISKRTESTLKGKFDLTFLNIYSSNPDCPDSCLQAKAYFVAEITF